MNKCPACGATLPDDLPAGLCAACLPAAKSPAEDPTRRDASRPSTIRFSLSLLVEKPGDKIGRYKLLEQIGEGGMGTVWVAEQQEPVRRKVALKVIKLGMDTKQVIARFEAERQALALMDHPHIAKVLDAGATETGRPFFVMELVSGIRITDYCNRHNLTTRERLELFVQVCKAIQHAHQKGILHRDIKPPNILITLHDELPAPRLIDFGIAKALAGQRLTDRTVHTTIEEFIGTPAYMSPEQAEMSALGIDARSDIYSLGVLLYELLTGFTPFEGERFSHLGPTEIRRIIREEDPPRPSTRLTSLKAQEQETVARRHQCPPPKLIHSLRGDLDRIVMTCLEKDRTHRYPTANELALDVQRYLKGEPINPPKSGVRFPGIRKFVRRHKPAFTAGLAALLLASLLALLLVATRPSRTPSVEELLKNAAASLEHYDQEGSIATALTDLKEAKKIDPNDHRIWAKLGWAYWLQYEDTDHDEVQQEAYNCASNALSLNSDNAEGHLVLGLVAKARRDWVAATNHLMAAKEHTRSSDGVVLVSLAIACQSAGDRTNANLFARLARQAAGDQWDVFNRLGLFRLQADPRHGDLEGARTDFERAVELSPREPLPHRHLGQVLLLQNAGLDNKKEAYAQLETSRKLRNSPKALAALGSAYMRDGKYAEAARYYCDASREDPSRYVFHLNAALALRENPDTEAEAKRHFEQALRQTEDALKAGGEKALVRAHRGICLAGLERRSEARNDLEIARQEAAGDFLILGVVRDGYRLLGDDESAAEIDRLRQKEPE